MVRIVVVVVVVLISFVASAATSKSAVTRGASVDSRDAGELLLNSDLARTFSSTTSSSATSPSSRTGPADTALDLDLEGEREIVGGLERGEVPGRGLSRPSSSLLIIISGAAILTSGFIATAGAAGVGTETARSLIIGRRF